MKELLGFHLLKGFVARNATTGKAIALKDSYITKSFTGKDVANYLKIITNFNERLFFEEALLACRNTYNQRTTKLTARPVSTMLVNAINNGYLEPLNLQNIGSFTTCNKSITCIFWIVNLKT